MIHYHGTPITPRRVLYELAGKNFCVSFANPQDVKVCHEIGQSVLIDNGAWPTYSSGIVADWSGFMTWVREWLDYPTTWAIIPDVIDGSESENDHLISLWLQTMGTFKQAAPVWHLHESLARLKRLVRGFDRVCFGSSGDYARVSSPSWNNRVNEAFNAICVGGRVPCWIHMLRGMSLTGSIYPFASVDSTDVARNHNRKNNAKEMAEMWDVRQNPARWEPRPEQSLLPALAESSTGAA